MEEHKLGLTAMLLSVSSIISGAVMYWIVDAQASGFRFDNTAIILIIAGLAGFVLSALVCAISPRRISDEHIFDNQAAGPPAVNTTMTEEGC
jgi:Na+-transporting NADH:ubiquinone oxidoreductase subunit NqrC